MVFPGLDCRSDDRETVEYYRAIARATRLGLMLYNNPRGYGVDLRPDLLAQLADEPNVVAIKDESIIGTLFEGVPMESVRVGDYDAIVPAIEGWARVTGHNTIFVDDRDPLAHGFLLK
ncbi:unnamed protein product [Candidatus Paraburkholderia kirkii UZHbot1]|uniref:WGS project CAFE00000000 data, contig bkir_c63 n=1 Tax=Candidatus Paraburkholderia kirkii UZHbot1 TaxID=1055526 RepID=U3UB44_9BURK|nr:unnamed protein product [Candidatus Paraburkholderia kirkii UZHbot1]